MYIILIKLHTYISLPESLFSKRIYVTKKFFNMKS